MTDDEIAKGHAYYLRRETHIWTLAGGVTEYIEPPDWDTLSLAAKEQFARIAALHDTE